MNTTAVRYLGKHCILGTHRTLRGQAEEDPVLHVQRFQGFPGRLTFGLALTDFNRTFLTRVKESLRTIVVIEQEPNGGNIYCHLVRTNPTVWNFRKGAVVSMVEGEILQGSCISKGVITHGANILDEVLAHG